jgi:cysteinyl-tRNA synthetase
VTYVRNITDIEDKIIKRALERGITIRAADRRDDHAMHRDFAALGTAAHARAARHRLRAADAVADRHRCEGKGLAYQAEGGDVNYAVRRFAGYGKLSGKSLDELRAGERVAVLGDKEDPLDFVLWKAAKPDEPADAQWPSATARAGRAGTSNARP